MHAKRIILHHSLTADGKTVSWNAIRRYHIDTLGWNDIGYHFGIELINDTYEILSGRMINIPGAHTKGCNHDSLGICFVGNFDLVSVPSQQWELGVKLVSSLCNVLGIPLSQIHGHREYAAKSCPGKLFDAGKFIHNVAAFPIPV